VGIRNWVPWLGGQSELGTAALLTAVWWDLRLASLLTHLFISSSVCLSVSSFVQKLPNGFA